MSQNWIRTVRNLLGDKKAKRSKRQGPPILNGIKKGRRQSEDLILGSTNHGFRSSSFVWRKLSVDLPSTNGTQNGLNPVISKSALGEKRTKESMAKPSLSLSNQITSVKAITRETTDTKEVLTSKSWSKNEAPIQRLSTATLEQGEIDGTKSAKTKVVGESAEILRGRKASLEAQIQRRATQHFQCQLPMNGISEWPLPGKSESENDVPKKESGKSNFWLSLISRRRPSYPIGDKNQNERHPSMSDSGTNKFYSLPVLVRRLSFWKKSPLNNENGLHHRHHRSVSLNQAKAMEETTLKEPEGSVVPEILAESFDSGNYTISEINSDGQVPSPTSSAHSTLNTERPSWITNIKRALSPEHSTKATKVNGIDEIVPKSPSAISLRLPEEVVQERKIQPKVKSQKLTGLERQLRFHTFGRVKGFVLNKGVPKVEINHPILGHDKAASSCFQVAWRVRVWIESDFSDSVFQMIHVCQPTCSYQRDACSTISEQSQDIQGILWYRYLGRQVELDLSRRKAAITCNPQGDLKTQALEEKRRQLSLRICARCGQGFSLLFNRRLECHSCGLGVCRKCSKWRQDEEAWECEACEGQRDFKEQSCPWFYGHLEKKLNRFESAKVIKSVGYQNQKMDSSTSTVRDHIEKVVESLIGDDLDSVNIIHLSEHPSYKRLFEDYHSSLSDSLSLLTQAIQMVIEKQPTSPEDPTPTTAHIKLKYWIERLIMDVEENELIWENESDFLIRDLPNDKEMYFSQSYEDLLSTAIINKVVLNSKKRPGLNRPDKDSHGILGPEDNIDNANESMEPGTQSSLTSSGQSGSSTQIRHRNSGQQTTDSSTTTSSTTSTSSGNSERSQSVASSVSSPSDEEIPSASSSITSEAFSPMEESRENSLSPTLGNAPQFLIEEEIEETTAYQSEDEVTSKVVKTTIAQTSTLSKYPSMHSIDCVLADIVEFEKGIPVCFPEYGLDLVERKEFDELDGKIPEDLSILALSASTWEDNWLFCQKRLKVRNSFRVNKSALFYNEPVAMLVPNPNDDQIIRAMIGNREIDEVSELSERQSVASLEYSDSSCSEPEDEEVPTSDYPSLDGQKDLEHTEYAVFPNQRHPKPNPEEFFFNRPAPTGDVGFLEVPRNVKVVAGKAARLKAVVSGTKPIDVLWFRGCKLIESSPNVEIRRSSGDCHEMILYHTDALTEGHYSCAVVNQSGEQWHDFNLSVQPSHEDMTQPQILEHPDDLVVEEGHSVRFGCVVTGYPEPRVSFLRNGKVLRANENVSIELLPNGTHRLEIKRCQARHCTQFAVRAENKLGVAERMWNVEVVLVDDDDSMRSIKSQDLNVHENVTPHQSQSTLNDISSCVTSEVDEMHSTASTLALRASSNNTNNNIHHQYLTSLAEAKNTNLVNEAKNELLAQDLGYGESDLDTATTSASELEFIDLDRPPARPGTIADREHRKWTENAISLLNNPYSKENIERRLTRGSRDSLHLSSPTDFVRSVNTSHNDLMMTLNAPRKIDCGLRSINSARYRRDYYINGDMEEVPKFKRLSSSSDTKESPSSPPFRTVTSTSHPKDIKHEVKRKGQSDPGPIENHVEPPQVNKSPNSSPSEKDWNRSKVEEEIARFQKQIEMNRSERTRVRTWELRKSNSHRLGSMDSLLSVDSDYSSGRSAPPLPPKGKYVSNDSLVPPHLPPKTKINNHHHGLKKKQVSISTSEVFIHSDSCERSDSDDLTSSTVSSVKSMATPDREILHDTESLGGSNDSLATLPSVKELATKFQPKPTVPKVEQQVKIGDGSKKNKPRALMKLSSQTSKQENGSTSCSPIDSFDQARQPKFDHLSPISPTNTSNPPNDFESLSEFSSDESQEDPDDPSTLDISSSLSESGESSHSPDSLEESLDDLESLQQEEAEVEELTIHGQVVLEEDLDFEPQIIGADDDDEEDDYFEDIDLNSPLKMPVNQDGVIDDWPYSSEDEDNFRLSMDGFSQSRFTGSSLASIPEEPNEPLTPEERHFVPSGRRQPNPNHFIWSDLEISSKRHPTELWKRHSLDRETDPEAKGLSKLHQKYASESNIEDALIMMEPGLRKISKETHFTSDESSPSGSGHDYEEQFDHIYSTIDEDPLDENIYEECFGQNSMEESGFYSNIGASGPESGSNPSGHVTLIKINQNGANPCQKASSVTVNGQQIYCNGSSDAPEPSTPISAPLIQLSQRVQTVIPIRKREHEQHSLTADPTNHNTTTIHSLTARSVPQKFREGLKKGMPFMPDRNIKASVESRASPVTKVEGSVTTPTSQDTPLPVHTPTARNAVAHSTQLNIVYDSENKDLVPYPDGDIIRSPSPEHSGIPAVPVSMPLRSKDEEYTSDESYGSLPPSRKHPPNRKKSKNGSSNSNNNNNNK